MGKCICRLDDGSEGIKDRQECSWSIFFFKKKGQIGVSLVIGMKVLRIGGMCSKVDGIRLIKSRTAVHTQQQTWTVIFDVCCIGTEKLSVPKSAYV
jgi:hypothetical protein